MLRHIFKTGTTFAHSISKRNFTPASYSLVRVIESVPALGESITEGSIAQWHKSEGDIVNVDDVIAVVETDKVTVDIKSARSGIFVRKIAEFNVREMTLVVERE